MPEHPVPHPDMAGYVLGVLEPGEARAFTHHLQDCEDCRQEVAELASVRTALDQALPAPDVPPGLAERTLAAVERAATGSSAEAPAADGELRPLPLPERTGGRRGRPAAWVAAAAAALVAAALLIGVVADGSGGSGRRIALVAPDGSATDSTATLRRSPLGIEVVLAVAGLEPTPAGSFYECWYVGEKDSAEAPARLSAGTFTVPAGGRATVQMTTAADPARYPRIEVTLEPDDGDPARAGAVVLRSRPRN